MILIRGGTPDSKTITVYRSSSGGWVIENPVPDVAIPQMLTLRSIYRT